MATVSEELHALVDRLSLDNQRRLLELAQMLNETDPYLMSFPKSKLPPTRPGSALRHFNIPLEDVEVMERALEDCDQNLWSLQA
ncbi:MAG TPA: hypothetical protein VF043_38770 [Ktedonobacteraceae bacterium]